MTGDTTGEPHVVAHKAHYPAGPGWWLAGDNLWYPPPEPAEPPGTVHQVGDTKPTWQGLASWDGTRWVVADPASYTPANVTGYVPSEPVGHYSGADGDFAKPPRVSPNVVRVVNSIALTLGGIVLLGDVAIAVLLLAGVVGSATFAVFVLGFLFAFPAICWMLVIGWLNGMLRLPGRGSWSFGRRGGLSLTDAFALVAPGWSGAVIAMWLLAIAASARGAAVHFGRPGEHLGVGVVFFLVPVMLNSLAVGVMIGEAQRQQAERAGAAKP